MLFRHLNADNRTLLGTVTRSPAWQELVLQKRTNYRDRLEPQNHPRKAELAAKLGSIDRSKWMCEKAMYPDVIKANEGALYAPPSDLVVVDTSSKKDFPADISISEYRDGRLLHCIQY